MSPEINLTNIVVEIGEACGTAAGLRGLLVEPSLKTAAEHHAVSRMPAKG